MKTYILWVGLWRSWWGWCPECNSDAPDIDTCMVCAGDGGKYEYPTTDEVTEVRWSRFAIVHDISPDRAGSLIAVATGAIGGILVGYFIFSMFFQDGGVRPQSAIQLWIT